MKINWEFKQHMKFTKGGQSLYRDNELGLQMETTGKRRYYFIDNDKREFKTEEDLIEAYKLTPQYLRSQLKIV